MSRQQRRAHARIVQKLGTLEQHFDRVLRDVRADFERIGEYPRGFSVHIGHRNFPDSWHVGT